ncbi:2'-5' RNA ligase [Chitinophaga skermanii]|uniref:2'-5' RNA ligase n=1 Tax=Chitinophaga skermanii TaxID=331697 RepID=A0A327QQL2_9BACT|nr:2'-5' RNA ligase [Chitinophaga skermanii]
MQQPTTIKSFPLIVTLQMEPSAQAYFDDLRTTHFPKHANYLKAHITLFHKLPSNNPRIDNTLQQLAQRPPFELLADKVYSFGQGVAFHLQSLELQQLHVAMQASWSDLLIRQDQQTIIPHITIQNKVTNFKATQLKDALLADFTPFNVKVIGFQTWYYKGGPWKQKADFNFSL